jgi:hypothetical protein
MFNDPSRTRTRAPPPDPQERRRRYVRKLLMYERPTTRPIFPSPGWDAPEVPEPEVPVVHQSPAKKRDLAAARDIRGWLDEHRAAAPLSALVFTVSAMAEALPADLRRLLPLASAGRLNSPSLARGRALAALLLDTSPMEQLAYSHRRFQRL